VAYVSLSHPKAERTLSLAWRKKAPLSPASEALKNVIFQSTAPAKLIENRK